MKKSECLHSHKVVCVADAGARIDACIQEGLILALTEDRKVEFEFNGTLIAIDPEEVVQEYFRRWSVAREPKL
jgi:hypothetical protein